MRHTWQTSAVAALFLFIGALEGLTPAFGQSREPAKEFAATLAAEDRKAFEAWYAATVFFDAALDAYWSKVEAKRSVRRKKRSSGQAFASTDYVQESPPKYDGPALDKVLLQKWRAFQKQDEGETPGKAPDELPGLDDYLAAAREHYNFAPERIPEIEFKRRYASKALSLGLSKDQVVRIYALETGGNGTADMQAGIHPITKRGRPISSALGYAQLLAANSVSVLSKHGDTFRARLRRMARAARNPKERQRLMQKYAALTKMVRYVKSVPYNWARHVQLARTPPGMGVHVMNIDGDVGPWMQVTKIAGLKTFAADRGRPELSGAEIELMNLAGPATGLEMMQPAGKDKPTSNFFSRRGYYRNSIVRGRSAAELLVALEERMNVNIKNQGAQTFLTVFDEVIAAAPALPRRQSLR